MIYINKQLKGKKHAEVNKDNFPLLFSGDYRVRDISIIKTARGIEIQTILNEEEIKREIADFLHNKYQAHMSPVWRRKK